jgi:glycosyltransferase involved in cell wall biosynthesis
VIDLRAPTAAEPAVREHQAIAANDDTLRALGSCGPFDIVYERASLWSVSPMMFAASISAIGIIELNAPLVEEQTQYRALVHTATARAMLASSLRAASLVVAVSDEVAASARVLAGEGTNVHVVPNGVDARRFTPASRDRGAQTRFVVGFVGTLKPWHGLSTLVDAFASITTTAVPQAHLLIVGDGPERQNLVEAMARRGLADHMTITGAVAHDEVPALLGTMDVAVAPYPALGDFYFSPLKLTEYMAAGLPVVASDIGQVSSVVHHDRTGLLVAPGDAASLAAALMRLHGDSHLRHRLGREARVFVAEQRTWAKALERILMLARRPIDDAAASAPPVEQGASR